MCKKTICSTARIVEMATVLTVLRQVYQIEWLGLVAQRYLWKRRDDLYWPSQANT